MLNGSSSPASLLLRRNSILSSILDHCKSMRDLNQIHGLVIASGLSQDSLIVSKILSFSAVSDSGDPNYSSRVLFSLVTPRIFHWNAVIRGYSKSRNPNGSVSVFIRMLRSGAFPDYLTYPFLAKACSRLMNPELGCSVHGQIVRNGFEVDGFVSNSLIHMYASFGDFVLARKVFDGMPLKNPVSWNSMVDGYAKCGELGSARQLFDSMPRRDVLSWSCLIDGYVKNGDYRGAMAVFDQMGRSGVKPNEVTMVSVLCACSHLGALDKGRTLHQCVVDNNLPLTIILRTSLVDMYAKCGAINEAFDMFRRVPVETSDVLLWNAMIRGLATHGLVKESLDLFKEMKSSNQIRPDEITYLSLLHACAHGGLVSEAWHFFECLKEQGMVPKIEHFACMVDVMARAGQTTEAYHFLCQMPIEPTPSMLGALMNGCMNHGKLELAKMVGRRLVEMDPNHDGRYVGLANVYATDQRWGEAKSTRQRMERVGVRKCPGFSLVEVDQALHRFIAHDKSHPSYEVICMMLSFLGSQMRPHENQHFLLFV
ncbi:unnamed protein product [Cuscuta campestris]|uniref:Pentacotripeptide-repeat region of PRORP domain-containing protein n=1 Tax=Cuscuta campestris TaxID=132261 RepID=A0A484K2I8_9ASTE|nr:unnamed protein product [Cuscuta campestris]